VKGVIWNREAETMAPQERRRLQVERLRWTVAHAAARVPFHRDALRRVGVGADDLRSLDDLRRLPFTGKADLREHYPFGLFAVPRQQVIRIHASSGTRGKPTVVGYTRADLATWREAMARSLAAGGAQPGDLIQIGYGYGLFTGGLGFHDGAEYMGMTVVPVSSGNTQRQILLLQDFRPQGLAVTPSFALHLAEAMREQGISPREVGLRYGLFGAEPWTEAMREQLEAIWGISAVDFYGLSEIVGPGVAVECAEAKRGLHVNEDLFLPEVVDPASGEPLPAGQEGELVFTTLTKEALPMIRYRTGDVTRLDAAPCRCGRTTVRMARVVGRTDDMMVIKGVNVYPSQVEAALLTLEDLAPHYQLVVDRTAAFPDIAVHVEPAERLVQAWGGFAREGAEVAALAGRVAERLRGALGLNPDIEIVPPKTIPRSEGKAVRVVERRRP
jgi:phenylacetate-CoA ligase